MNDYGQEIDSTMKYLVIEVDYDKGKDTWKNPRYTIHKPEDEKCCRQGVIQYLPLIFPLITGQ